MHSDWKPELDAIVSARHGGRIETVLPALRRLDERYPQVPEIAAELAFSLATAGHLAEALGAYERALALGLPSPAEQANTLVGHAVCLLRLGHAGKAASALEVARIQFPDHNEFKAYLALAWQHSGRGPEAFRLLFETLIETSEDLGLTAHQRTLRVLAGQLGTPKNLPAG